MINNKIKGYSIIMGGTLICELFIIAIGIFILAEKLNPRWASFGHIFYDEQTGLRTVTDIIIQMLIFLATPISMAIAILVVTVIHIFLSALILKRYLNRNEFVDMFQGFQKMYFIGGIINKYISRIIDRYPNATDKNDS
jgi:hypothetical protein